MGGIAGNGSGSRPNLCRAAACPLGYVAACAAVPRRCPQSQCLVVLYPMERFQLFSLRRRAPALVRWTSRLALIVAAVSALSLLSLLVWATGNASRFAQHYDILLVLNGILAAALLSWVLVMSGRLLRQVKRRQFGARLTSRFALYFTLIGVLPGVLIYVLSVQFMSRSIESWFNVRVDTALEAGLNLGRAALDTQLADLDARARNMAARLSSS